MFITLFIIPVFLNAKKKNPICIVNVTVLPQPLKMYVLADSNTKLKNCVNITNLRYFDKNSKNFEEVNKW